MWDNAMATWTLKDMTWILSTVDFSTWMQVQKRTLSDNQEAMTTGCKR